MVDYSICNVEVDNDKPYGKSLIIRKDADGNEIRGELQQDSTGVREFFAWAVQIYISWLTSRKSDMRLPRSMSFI